MELLFIIRPGAPDHGAAGAPLLVLLIIRLLFIITALQMALLVCLVPLLQMVCAAGDLLVISASVSWDHDSGHVLAILY